MKISKIKIGILFFILFIMLVETISLAISNVQEDNKEIKSIKESILEDETIELNKEEQETLELINKYRKQNGLEYLKIYPKLQETAEIKAKDIVEKEYFSHTSPDLGTPFELMDKTGVFYKVAGENLAGNISPEKAVEAWINSPTHKENILEERFAYTGISVVESPVYGRVFVQMFIGIE